MRNKLFVVLLSGMLGGCATGYAADWFRDRSSILNPQLIRYGLDVKQSRCVGEKLGRRLSRQELRKFQENAAAVQAPASAQPLALANLRAVAAGLGAETRLELDSAAAACSVPGLNVAAAPAASVPAGTRPNPVAPVISAPTREAMARPRSAWLNLGAAESGQSIAIDAATIQQAGAARTAWFRMTDPGTAAPGTNLYRLRIDCAAKTVQPLALRQLDAAGAEVMLRQYTPDDAGPGPAEAGTVLEIAYLSLCT